MTTTAVQLGLCVSRSKSLFIRQIRPADTILLESVCGREYMEERKKKESFV